MDITKNRVALRVWGDAACFTRPEMKAERMSYDVITPSAARGILEAIYWKPEIRWVIDRLHILKPIQFTNIRRNEVGAKGPSSRTLNSYLGGKNNESLALFADDSTNRQQRAAMILRDVDYLIEAHYEVLDGGVNPPQKHYEMFKRRSEKGQCFHHPYLGCREFAAHFAWHEGGLPLPHPELLAARDLGWMLHDISFVDNRTPRFFRAVMHDGVIEVPELDGSEVHG